MFKSFLLELNISAVQTNYIFAVNSNDLNTIRLDLVIKDNAALVDLTGKIVRLAIRKPDNTVVFQSGGVTDGPGGKCEFILEKQAALVPGRHEAEVMIYDGDSEVTVTTKFYYEVKKAALSNDDVESSSDFPAISHAIAAGDFLQTIDLIAVTEAAGEVNLAKEKADGTQFATLQERLNDSDVNIGEKTTLPTWLQDSIRDVLKKHDDDLRQRGLNAGQPPYNVKGDGTDETTVIQQVVDDSITKNVPVIFPSGIFGFNGIKLKNSLRILGAGKTKSIFKHLGTGRAFYNDEAGAIGSLSLSDFSLELQLNTTVGIEFARVYMSTIRDVNITGKDCAGIGISFDDGVTLSSYYNSCYDVSINGYFNGNRTLTTGFKFANSANSNRLTNCRTVSVKTGVDVATDYCNHIVITGCAFESFDVGVRLNGDICQVAFNRFETGGIGVEMTPTSGSNYIIGNTSSNVTTPIKNDNPEGNNFIFDYAGVTVKYIGLASTGGFTSNVDMRTYSIRNIGYADLSVRTTAPATLEGRLVYADGVTWNPGDGKGLYINDGTLYRKIAVIRSGTTRPTTNLFVGMQFFDATLNKPIWRNAANDGWVDATGATV